MKKYSVEVRMPVAVFVEVEADTEEEAEELALAQADYTQGELDGLAQVVGTEELE